MYKQHEQNQNEQKLLEYLQNENPIHLQTSFISKNSSDSENDQEYDVNLIRNNTITTILNQSNIQIQKNAKQSQAQQQLIENVGDLKQYKQVIFASEKYRDQKKNNVTDQNRIYYQLYYGSGKFRKFLMIILLLLGFFEKPSWCSSDYIDDCSRLKNNSEIQIKLSQVPYINSSYLCILESSIIIILTLFKMIKSEFQKSDLKQQLRLKGFIIITIFQIIYHICKQFGNFDLLYNGILRIAYFVLYQRSIRRTLFTYIQLIKKGYPIFAMMCFNLFLFACIAKILFGRIDQAKVYFNTLTDGIYYLLILQTTANFPDIMLPSYKEYRVSSIFFISFLALNYLLLFNMLIGVIHQLNIMFIYKIII